MVFVLFAFLVFDEVPFHIIQPLPDGLEELSSVTIEFMSCVSAKWHFSTRHNFGYIFLHDTLCCIVLYLLHLDRRLTKRSSGHIQMAKPQTSLRSNASGQDHCHLSYIFNKGPILCWRTATILTKMRGCASWSESSLYAYVLLFSQPPTHLSYRIVFYYILKVNKEMFSCT